VLLIGFRGRTEAVRRDWHKLLIASNISHNPSPTFRMTLGNYALQSPAPLINYRRKFLAASMAFFYHFLFAILCRIGRIFPLRRAPSDIAFAVAEGQSPPPFALRVLAGAAVCFSPDAKHRERTCASAGRTAHPPGAQRIRDGCARNLLARVLSRIGRTRLPDINA
jgi:hypothetical protein